MKQLKDMFLSSVIIQGIMTLLLWGSTIYMAIAEIAIPDALLVADGVIITFWFKTKNDQA